MAVQAHYNLRQPLFLVRGGAAPEGTARAAVELPQPHREMAAPEQAPPLLLHFGHGDGDGGAGRKRPRGAEAAVAPQLFSLQPQGHKVISLAQPHKRPATTLRLDFDEGSEHVSSTSSAASSLLSDELAAQCDQYKNDMDRLLQEHAERLRRAMADVRRRQYRSLLGAAEAAAARRMREKEAEISKAARRGAELEDQLARLRAEAAAWQAKALADQSTAAALHAQLQQAAAAQARGKAEQGSAAADDAESGFVDPDRVEEIVAPARRPCRSCRVRLSSIVLLPCRHLCACDACEPAVSAAASCPMCRGAVTGTVQVLFA